ncbi:hypothetical protein BV898_18734 [Hypsibius exemplaris]|uniref:G-protein coupled receptors family 1 profile domain-containing protein n=1 Tax=Hypsibius exemplaris TaxID=2072580 RepID=A0A9X6NPL3_HYPEX|nr:hypothetical protein BV898_18734 [Hypsibius exemplaris]
MTNSTPNGTTLLQDNSEALHGQLTAWFVLLITFSLFGIISNALLLRIIANHKKLRNDCSRLIIHLLITSLIMCGIHFPINAVVIYGKAYWFVAVPSNICTYIYSIQVATANASNWTEAWLAINRLVAIIFPYHYPKWVAPWPFRAMVAFSWGMGIATVLPIALGFAGSFVMSGLGHCAMLPGARSLVSIIFLGVSAYGPYIIVGVVLVVILGHSMTFRTVKVTAPADKQEVAQSAPTIQLRSRRFRVARMLLVSFVFCLVCNIPTYALLSLGARVLVRHPLIFVWMRLSLISQYAFSPIIFLCFNQDYRAELRRIVTRPGRRLGSFTEQGGSICPKDSGTLLRAQKESNL